MKSELVTLGILLSFLVVSVVSLGFLLRAWARERLFSRYGIPGTKMSTTLDSVIEYLARYQYALFVLTGEDGRRIVIHKDDSMIYIADGLTFSLSDISLTRMTYDDFIGFCNRHPVASGRSFKNWLQVVSDELPAELMRATDNMRTILSAVNVPSLIRKRIADMYT